MTEDFNPPQSASGRARSESSASVGDACPFDPDARMDDDDVLTDASTECPPDIDDAEESDANSELTFRGTLAWWDCLQWSTLHAIYAPTTSLVPGGLDDATAHLKYRLAAAVHDGDARRAEQEEERAWKALMAIDALVFSNMRERGTLSRREVVAERLRLAEDGQ